MEESDATFPDLAPEPELPILQVFRLTTSHYLSGSSYSVRKELRRLKRQSSGHEWFEEDIRQAGADLAMPVNLMEAPDGVYKLIAVDRSTDPETGALEDYSWKLVPLDSKERPPESQRELEMAEMVQLRQRLEELRALVAAYEISSNNFQVRAARIARTLVWRSLAEQGSHTAGNYYIYWSSGSERWVAAYADGTCRPFTEVEEAKKWCQEQAWATGKL